MYDGDFKLALYVFSTPQSEDGAHIFFYLYQYFKFCTSDVA